MTKKGPLGTAEKYMIKHVYQTKDIADICKELDRAKGLVQDYIDEVIASTPTMMADNIPSSRGATVMTPAGSEMSDDYRKKHGSNPKSRSSCVTEIKQKNE